MTEIEKLKLEVKRQKEVIRQLKELIVYQQVEQTKTLRKIYKKG